jgi:hypothetical protein
MPETHETYAPHYVQIEFKKGNTMSKGQNSKKEVKKPKAIKVKPATPSQS